MCQVHYKPQTQYNQNLDDVDCEKINSGNDTPFNFFYKYIKLLQRVKLIETYYILHI
jgi:hypothetical protein